MCPVPEWLGFWLSHPMVYRGIPGGLRYPALRSPDARGHYTKHLFRGTTGGHSPVWPASAVSERGLDPVALCHHPDISPLSSGYLSLSYLPAAPSSRPP